MPTASISKEGAHLRPSASCCHARTDGSSDQNRVDGHWPDDVRRRTFPEEDLKSVLLRRRGGSRPTRPASLGERLRAAAFRDDIAEGIVVALQRLYLGEQDNSATGVLHLGDLRKVLEELAG